MQRICQCCLKGSRKSYTNSHPVNYFLRIESKGLDRLSKGPGLNRLDSNSKITVFERLNKALFLICKLLQTGAPELFFPGGQISKKGLFLLKRNSNKSRS